MLDRVQKLFLAACDKSPQQRAAFLDEECGDDLELRDEVESLLASHDAECETPEPGRADEDAKGNGFPRYIGSCRIIREIGRGGMGIVYLGVREDAQFKRRVAVKVLKRGMDTEDILRRFELERHVLGALNHTNIARLFDGGETDDGRPFFFMEFVEGLPIDEYCDVHRLHIGERLELFMTVCQAVHYMHQNLVVHRDLKPGNIFVTRDGAPKLLDFGIVKLINPEMSLAEADLTRPELRVMTPEYASPEQVRGHPVTTASDVYSLGVMLYELMTGHRPYQVRDLRRQELERVVCEQDPDAPSTAVTRVETVQTGPGPDSTRTITPESVSRVREGRPDRLRRRLTGDIDNIVLMAMRKEPQRRYVSAEQLAGDIRRHLDGLPVIARPDTFTYRATKFIGRHRVGVAAGIAIAATLVAGTTVSSWQASVAETQRDRSDRIIGQSRKLARTFIFDFNEDGSPQAQEKVLGYLSGLAEEAGDDPQLRRDIADGYNQLGDKLGGSRGESLGDTAGAILNYRKAVAIRQELVAASPDDADLRHELAMTHTRIGDMLVRTSKFDDALKEHTEALRIFDALVQAEPTSIEARRALGVAENNTGAVLARMPGQSAKAKEHYERCLEIRRELVREKPADPMLLRDLAVVVMRVAGRLEAAGDLDGALDRYLESLVSRERLLAIDPENEDRYRRDVAITQLIIGQLYVHKEDPRPAMEYLHQCLPTFQKNVELMPKDSRSKRDLAAGHELLGRAYALQGDWQNALVHYDRFQEIIVPLSNSAPDVTEYQLLAAECHEHFAEVALAMGEVGKAIERYTRALTIVRGLPRRDSRNLTWETARARLLTGLGGALAAAGDDGEALRQLDEAQRLYQSLRQEEPDDASVRNGLAEALLERSKLAARVEGLEPAIEYVQEALATAVHPALRRRIQEDLERYNGDR